MNQPGGGYPRCVASDAPPGLRFGLDDEPGLRRRGRARISYVDDATGEAVTDPDTLARIRALAVPPAWTDVWIAADPCAHVQATGRDARGRKQYRYHDDFRRHQEEAKFDQLVPFGHALPGLRRRVDTDLRRRGLPRERLLALVVSLLERTLVRVGNEEYSKANGSFGLTTLRDRHAKVHGREVTLRFNAKSNKLHAVTFEDPRLAKLVRRSQELPGETLFQYVAVDGQQHPIRSSDVNEYLRETTGIDVTAKSFRTWTATLYAAVALGGAEPPSSDTEGRRTVNAMLKVVSAELNNTPAVCRRSYVHPGIVTAYRDGTLADRWASTPARGSSRLSTDERKLVKVLEGVTNPGAGPCGSG
jgi:DNA topoisomerase I